MSLNTDPAPATIADINNFKLEVTNGAITDKDENLNTINIDNLNTNRNLSNNCNSKPKSNTVSASSANSANANSNPSTNTSHGNKDTMFTLKKWNLVAMWSWDVECEVEYKLN